MKTIREGAVVVLPRNDEIADVFTGDGWSHHSVFRKEKGWPRLIEGESITEAEFKFLRKAMN